MPRIATRKGAFLAGFKALSPLILGVVPFALIAGISAISAGLSNKEAIGMSLIIFAGAAQLATVELIGHHASTLVIIFTALIINLRFFMYSASLAPHFQGLPLYLRGGLAYLITDQAFAVSITGYSQGCREYKYWYYLGAAIPMWCVWQTGTVAGVYLGTQIPKSWALDFAIPLTFLALLVPSLRDRPSVIAALISGLLALLCHELPYNLGLFLGALGGIVAGCLTDWRVRNGG